MLYFLSNASFMRLVALRKNIEPVGYQLAPKSLQALSYLFMEGFHCSGDGRALALLTFLHFNDKNNKGYNKNLSVQLKVVVKHA